MSEVEKPKKEFKAGDTQITLHVPGENGGIKHIRLWNTGEKPGVYKGGEVKFEKDEAGKSVVKAVGKQDIFAFTNKFNVTINRDKKAIGVLPFKQNGEKGEFLAGYFNEAGLVSEKVKLEGGKEVSRVVPKENARITADIKGKQKAVVLDALRGPKPKDAAGPVLSDSPAP